MVDVVAVVLFAFGTLPKINAVALTALAHPMIPIMANERSNKNLKEVGVRKFILSNVNHLIQSNTKNPLKDYDFQFYHYTH